MTEYSIVSIKNGLFHRVIASFDNKDSAETYCWLCNLTESDNHTAYLVKESGVFQNG